MVATLPPLPSPPNQPRRIVYLGSPPAAVAPFEALVDAGFDIALVITNSDKRRGRGSARQPTPVKDAAIRCGIPVSHDLDDALQAKADLGVVVAFGRLIPRPVLEVLPMVNLHFSLLPRWRGAAPVEWAILSGDDITGVCLMAVAEELDTGDVFAREETPLGLDNSRELADRLSLLGSRLLIDRLTTGLGRGSPQSGESTYARKLTTDDFQLDFTRSALDLHRVVRLGRAWTTLNGRRLRVLAATPIGEGDGPPGALDGAVVQCGQGRLRLEEVQVEGKRPQMADVWRRGARLPMTAMLGGDA